LIGVIQDMQWRRGLILAVINLCIAVPLIVRGEAREWRYLRTAPLRQAEVPGESDVRWAVADLCDEFRFTNEEKIATMANMPAAVVSAWGMPCPARFTVASAIERNYGEKTRKTAVLSSVAFGALIAIQWLILGSFPLLRPSPKWFEPGILITICAGVGGAMALIPALGSLCLLPMLVVFFAWLVWLGFVFVKASMKGWKLFRDRLA
jgi:hypothetical protein